jgi:NAD(P)-dependent dehydrogenase (short-subunit alcohol dehydrogenase family)
MKTAVITGGSGGIGLACAQAMQERGYDVVLTARTEATLKAAAEQIGARWVAADSAEPESFAAVLEGLTRVDLLVHSAGVLTGTFVSGESIEDWDYTIRANLRSTFVVTQACLPLMGVGGRIVYISSSASKGGQKGRGAYAASKGGMNAFADSVRQEVAREGINVNVLIPAPVETPMLDGVSFGMHMIQSKDVADALVFLDGLDPKVKVPEIEQAAHSSGPLAPALSDHGSRA